MSKDNSSEIEYDMPYDMTDYYYRFRISAVKKTKEEYNKILKLLIDNNSVILASVDSDESRRILKKIRTLKTDFNTYANNLIQKRGINSCKDFSYHMENLMLVSNEAILFCEENIILNEDANIKTKFKYEGGKHNLRYIISRLKNIPYDLDLDEPINVIVNKTQMVLSVIVWISISVLVFLIMNILTYYPSEYINHVYRFLPFGNETTNALNFILSILVGYLFFLWINSSKNYRLSDTRSYVHSKTKNIVYKPFKSDNRMFKFIPKVFKYIFDFIASKN